MGARMSEITMDSTVIAAIIGAVGTITAALSTVWVTKRGTSVDSHSLSTRQREHGDTPNKTDEASERSAAEDGEKSVSSKRQGLRRDVRELIDSGRVAEVVDKKIPAFLDQLTEDYARILMDRFILPGFDDLREGKVHTFDELRSTTDLRFNSWLESEEGQQHAQREVVAWFNRELCPELEKLTNPICDKYKIPRMALSIERHETLASEVSGSTQAALYSGVPRMWASTDRDSRQSGLWPSFIIPAAMRVISREKADDLKSRLKAREPQLQAEWRAALKDDPALTQELSSKVKEGTTQHLENVAESAI
jgi:hypothetical protein